ncbi:MAG: hypothetical protein JXA82_03770 [Sedimentisphaerales bacterium]|nr:hypothetical protein [Sedimentisphaerales bacterium]
MQGLEQVRGLIVSQHKEWGEILSGFETRNKYVVLDEFGQELYLAMEEGGSFLVRSFLKALRPFEIVLMRLNQQPVFRIHRPFRFYFHEVEVRDAEGHTLGAIKRRFSILRRRYDVINDQGQMIYELLGPLLHPWTFEIRRGEELFGKITKRWSGVGKEMFTDADNFGVEWPSDWPARVKALFLGAVFLIDFMYFENVNDNR